MTALWKWSLADFAHVRNTSQDPTSFSANSWSDGSSELARCESNESNISRREREVVGWDKAWHGYSLRVLSFVISSVEELGVF